MLPKEKIKEHVRNARLRKALELFRESLSPKDSVSESDILQLSARNAKLEEKENKGTISVADADLERAKITDAILDLLNGCQSDTTLTALEQAIAALPIGKDAELGVLQLVNCDRTKPIRLFKRAFNDKTEAKKPFQFYFISACPNQMPSSFAERILYEIMDTQSLELNKSIHFPFDEGVFNRVRIENLPFCEADTEASKKKFKEYVQKRFAFANTDSLEKFIETGIPQLPYSHVTTIFTINETTLTDDEGELIAYLQWMVDTFKIAHPKVPTFIFLFVVYIRNLYDDTKVRPRSKKKVAQLESFCDKNETALFSGITPVTDMHFEDWLFNLGIQNPILSQNVITAFDDTLSANDKLTIDDERHFHMKDIETVQKKVVLTFRGD